MLRVWIVHAPTFARSGWAQAHRFISLDSVRSSNSRGGIPGSKRIPQKFLCCHVSYNLFTMISRPMISGAAAPTQDLWTWFEMRLALAPTISTSHILEIIVLEIDSDGFIWALLSSGIFPASDFATGSLDLNAWINSCVRDFNIFFGWGEKRGPNFLRAFRSHSLPLLSSWPSSRKLGVG